MQFKFKVVPKVATGTTGTSPAQPSKRLPTAANNVRALFEQSLEDEKTEASHPLVPAWNKASFEDKSSQRLAQALQEEDPTVFQYDDVLDDIKQGSDAVQATQQVRTDALEQKKRVGLTLRQGAEDVRTGSKRQAKYVDKVLTATDRRRAEQQIIEDKLLKKEKNARQDAEVFVTEAFKEELKRRKRFEEELEDQEIRDKIKAAEKQENGLGFADMYRNLLNGGLASSRGSEQAKELSAPRIDGPTEGELHAEAKLEAKDEAKEEVKEDIAEEVKEEPEKPTAATEVSSAEVAAAAAAVGPVTKKEHIAEQVAQRDQRVLTAKERYLARKRQQHESQEAPA
mmetsp:Transcript_95136/g.188475  ORF Transcript_95136/g.188475 Transcript_95136/m.188475 type:complete len:341 (+) Transcript_95136:106-1128(+)